MLKAVIKKRAYEDIVEQIRARIKKGKLRQGDLLPNERELPETFKVSRATFREAVLSLGTLKLIRRSQGHETYVIASSEENLAQPLAASFFHEKDNLIEIFSLRKIIEPEVARLGSENAVAEEVDKLERILRDQEKALASEGNPIRRDINFHHLLVQMVKNRVLVRLLLALFTKTRETHLQSE